MPILGDTNTLIRFVMEQELPSIDTAVIVVLKPSGERLELPANIVDFTPTSKAFEATLPELDEPGTWCAYVKITGPTWSGGCLPQKFYVHKVCE